MKKILLLIVIVLSITSCATRKYGCGLPKYKAQNFNR